MAVLQPAMAAARVFSYFMTWLLSLPVQERWLLISKLLLRNIAQLHHCFLAYQVSFGMFIFTITLDTAFCISFPYSPTHTPRGELS